MSPEHLSQLQRIAGEENVICDPDNLRVYECDAFMAAKRRPDVVVLPTNTAMVADVVRYAAAHSLPVVPRGAGSGLAGGVTAESDCIVLGLSRMNRILEIDLPNRRALVEAGVVNAHLTRAVAAAGFGFAPDPSSQAACTIGGNIANNSGGPHTLKYGVTLNHTLGVEMVLPDGETLWIGGAVEGMPGYDLLGVCVGNEGTFGIITKAWVKLTPVAKEVYTLLAIFDDFDAAAQSVSDVIAAGIIPAALEMLDDVFLPAVEEAYKFGFPLDAAAVLLIETDGLPGAARAEGEHAAQICRDGGAREVRTANNDKERKLLWRARKGAFGAVGRVTPSYVTQDGVVPRSKLSAVLQEVKEIGLRHKVTIANIFHAGDGNLHPCIWFDERNPEELERVIAAGAEILKRCVDHGGSVTGEHGIGIEKVNMMEYAFSKETLDVMYDIRQIFNPGNTFNAAKVLPSSRGCIEINKAFSVAAETAAQASLFLHRGAAV